MIIFDTWYLHSLSFEWSIAPSQLEKLSIVQNEQEKGMKYAFNVPENNDESRQSVAYNS